MTPDDTNLENRIDRDRRERENDLYYLLLLLFLTARRHAYAATRVGSDVFRAVTDVLMGRADLGLPGFTQTFAQQLALADAAGFHRTELVLPGDTKDEPVDYSQIAAQYVAQMLSTLHQRLGAELAKAPGRAAVKQAFGVGGYLESGESGESGAWTASLIAETSTGNAYWAGQARGWTRPEAKARLTGFRYVSVLDDRTTAICRAYDGVQLPPDHQWIRTHFPLNHFHCRGVMRPLFQKFTPTPEAQIPWTPPPMPGFGRAPAGFAEFIRTNAA